MKIWSWCLLGTLGLVGCEAPEVVETAAVESEIIGGAADANDPAVVLLFAQKPNSNQGTLCTATLIAPTVLVTAAHCVLPGTVGANATFRAFIGSDWNKPAANSWLSVSAVVFDPRFDINNLGAGHDMAVAILAVPSAIKPVAVNKTALSQPLLGKPVRLVGYGVTDGKAQVGAGQRRQVTTVLDDFNGLVMHIGESQHQTCQGDSGGPAFMTIGGAEVLAGVTSYGYAGCVNGGYDTRADIQSGFLAPYLKGK